jgi:hypothetical protein
MTSWSTNLSCNQAPDRPAKSKQEMNVTFTPSASFSTKNPAKMSSARTKSDFTTGAQGASEVEVDTTKMLLVSCCSPRVTMRSRFEDAAESVLWSWCRTTTFWKFPTVPLSFWFAFWDNRNEGKGRERVRERERGREREREREGRERERESEVHTFEENVVRNGWHVPGLVEVGVGVDCHNICWISLGKTESRLCHHKCLLL